MSQGRADNTQSGVCRQGGRADTTLPDYYETVARDVMAFCGPSDGRVWVDLGSGAGGLGLALLEKLPQSTLVLIDPDPESLARAVKAARERGLGARVVAVVGSAEAIPVPDDSVDVVISRGSIYFWQDRAQGLREVWRVLRPGGRAMIGGGLGSGYPQWARQEFIRRRRESVAPKGAQAVREFAEARSPETFRRLAAEAGLPRFEVVGEGGPAADDRNTGIGIWLRLVKEATQ
jgi:ubiquinone/menaquinone biosynthesis C-methylase UbiE